MKLQKETESPKSSPEPGKKHGKWYDDACGTAFALELVGERWSLLIVRELMFGGRRFSDLRGGLPGISAKVLTERLESLERAKIVQRRQLPPPASVQVYELTPWGYAAEGAIQELGRWAARSADHDPTLPLSPASLMMSFRTMFDPARAGDIRLRAAMHIGNEHFAIDLADGRLDIRRGEAEDARFTVVAPAASPIGAAVYGKVSFDALAGAGLAVAGDRDAAQAFVDIFELPEKIG